MPREPRQPILSAREAKNSPASAASTSAMAAALCSDTLMEALLSSIIPPMRVTSERSET